MIAKLLRVEPCWYIITATLPSLGKVYEFLCLWCIDTTPQNYSIFHAHWAKRKLRHSTPKVKNSVKNTLCLHVLEGYFDSVYFIFGTLWQRWLTWRSHVGGFFTLPNVDVPTTSSSYWGLMLWQGLYNQNNIIS